jgi:hypothetical protein
MDNEQSHYLNLEVAKSNGNQLAFPLSTGSGYPSTGMTKREYMATQLMAASLADGHMIDVAVDRSINAVDKLLIALGTTKEK